MEKGLLVGAGVLVAGVAAYIVVKKKKPQWLETAKKKASGVGKKTCGIVTGAKEAFRDGFASAFSEGAAATA